MDSSDRSKFIAGKKTLDPKRLSPEEWLLALRTAIDTLGDDLKHLPMVSVDELSRKWHDHVFYQGRSSIVPRTIAGAEISRTYVLQLVKVGSEYEHKPNRTRHELEADETASFLLLCRDGKFGLRTLRFKSWRVLHHDWRTGEPRDDRFRHCADQEVLGFLARKRPYEIGHPVLRVITEACKSAHQRRVEIAASLQEKSNSLTSLCSRIGVRT